jgi:two-component system, NarL family, sensor histidine kinase UhpB
VSPKVVSKAHALDSSLADPAELSRQLLKAQEEERRRISRELHDETGQALMVLRFHLEMLAGDTKNEDQKAKIQESLEVLDRSIEGLRRTIARLSPRVLEELGLEAAIRRQALVLAKHTGIKANLELREELGPIDHDVEVAVYRSVQEALHNLAKHSQAKNFTIRLARTGSKISLQVEDDGIGFSPRTASERGFGLTGMRERTVALGGSMRVHSESGRGTQIRILLPSPTAGASKHPNGSGAEAQRHVASARAS